MNLVKLLEDRARKHPDQPALVDVKGGADRVVSFRDLGKRVAAGAALLDRIGLKRGQVILVFQPVSIELYEFLLAAFHAGLRVMLADPSAGKHFLSLCCQRLQPDAFFGSWKAQCLRMSVPELRRIPIAIRSGAWFPRTRAWRTDLGNLPLLDVPDDEPALITFTSGSTGLPKAAMRTHGFLMAQHRALSEALDFQEGEVDLITLPVFVLANLASGLTSVLAATNLAKPGEPDIEAIQSQVKRQQVTRCAGSPAFFDALQRAGALPEFRKLYTGGAPVFPDLLRRLRADLTDAVIDSVYGSTEAEPMAHFSADDVECSAELTRKGGGLCSGKPVNLIQLRVIRDHWGTPLGPLRQAEFDDLQVDSGQAGEIMVTGEHVLKSYLGGIGDEETKVHVDGAVWHRTGDAGWFDAEGRIWLLGRCSEKLPMFPAPTDLPAEAMRYPFAIECAFREKFPTIRIAAMAWNDQRLLVIGQSQEFAPTVEIETLAADFGMSKIVYLPAIPLDRRHNAKIDYPELRRQLRLAE
ncbi:AMP-binding protein [Luteolibacter pohnpeiensis]|uniref:AMP-binding protein n=1 Tax=Luteolibacter pohnpeiensis TaxID=454153 RepID=A0A934S7M0_9BACT|nr:AMP-binding protein [Luteolibacter pohnpeiensis]MBK1882286.1 AMP-binding protein [Luteolibacter pohnpeiensis]